MVLSNTGTDLRIMMSATFKHLLDFHVVSMFMPIQISSRQILHYIHYITWLKWKWVEKSPCEWRCFSIRKKYIANSPRIPTQSTSHCCSLNQFGFFFSCAWCCASFAHSTRTHRHFAIQITKKNPTHSNQK